MAVEPVTSKRAEQPPPREASTPRRAEKEPEEDDSSRRRAEAQDKGKQVNVEA